MSTALIVFAKAPVAGLAKTRLMPTLGPEGAARLAERLLEHTLQEALALPVEHLELCVSPTNQHPAFNRARDAALGRLHITLQGEGDLGERMNRAISRALTVHSSVLLIGTDAPSLNSALLEQARKALKTNPAVFVPALDGGYALVGLTHSSPWLFTGMTWSTPQVMQDTRARASQLGLPLVELPPVADIDEPEDLAHLPEGWW
jgi:rSAM/selenodomain-associated transferase 1